MGLFQSKEKLILFWTQNSSGVAVVPLEIMIEDADVMIMSWIPS